MRPTIRLHFLDGLLRPRVLLALSLLMVTGCAHLDDILLRAETDNTSGRKKALLALEKRIRYLQPGDPGVALERARIDRFLLLRFESGPNDESPSASDAASRGADDPSLRSRFLPSPKARPNEPDAALRGMIISLALEGQFPCAAELLVKGANDEQASVRLTAVQGMREIRLNDVNVQQARIVLAGLLENDPNVFVRIEAAKTIGDIGARDWVEPLVKIVVDEAQDYSLRFQCYRAAKVLTGSDLPFVPDRWNEWLQSHK